MSVSADIELPTRIEVLGLQFYGRSGTVFINSLLDGHPQLLTVPGIQNLWLYAFLREHADAGEAALMTRFGEAFSGWFEPDVHLLTTYGLNQLGPDGSDFSCVPREDFFSHLQAVLPRLEGGLRRRFFIAVHLAYALTRGQALQPRMIIVFHSHDQPRDYIQPLLEDFPGAVRFLHTVREPLRGIESFIRSLLYRRSAFDILPVVLGHFAQDHSMPVTRYTGHTVPAHALLPYVDQELAPSRALRLEDVHYRPEQTLRGLCEWLAVDWHDYLLQSSFNDLPWWNNPESPRLSGFDPSMVAGSDTSFFSPLDIWRLQALLVVRLAKLGYPRLNALSMLLSLLSLPLSIWLPFRHEARLKRFSEDAARRRGVKLADKLARGSCGYVGLRLRLLGALAKDVLQRRHFVHPLGDAHAPAALGLLRGSWRASDKDRESIDWDRQAGRHQAYLRAAVRLGQDTLSGWLDQLHVYAQWYRGEPPQPTPPRAGRLILVAPPGPLCDAVLAAIAEFDAPCRHVEASAWEAALQDGFDDDSLLLIMTTDYPPMASRLAALGKTEYRDYMPVCLTSELGRAAAEVNA